MSRLNSVSSSIKCLVILLALTFMFVALNAGLALLPVNPKDTGRLYNLSFFTDQRAEQSRVLAQQSLELRKPLEFMVWSKERQNLSELYLQSLRSQINSQPFDAQLWSQLVFVEGEASTDLSQKHWAMARAARLNRWSLQGRSLVMRPCLIEAPKVMRGQGVELCAELLASLPESMSVNQLSLLLGVKPKGLLDALVAHGLRKPQGLAK